MSIKDWPGGVVTKNQVVPSGPYETSTASGIWTMDQVANYTKQGIWPTAGSTKPGIESFFSTYLYEGNATARSITNGIDLAGQGGLVWIKSRSDSRNNLLFDTERGATYYLRSNTTDGTLENATTLSSFNSDGFNIESAADVNRSTATLASWSWRKAPKFFDIVTWTGNGTAGRTIPHNLGSVPGMMIVKVTSIVEPWAIYHREMNGGVAPQNYHMRFTTGAEAADSDIWNNTAPTSSVFTVGGNDKVNANNQTYVAYVFANETNSDSMIKCGGYTGVYAGAEVNLGWQPQWILFKSASSTGDWFIFDAMRGIVTGGLSGDGDAALFPNTSGAENVNTWGVDLTATGFITYGNNVAATNDMIYMAIRAPMMVAPTAATDVFAISTATNTYDYQFQSNFPVDMALKRENNNTSDPHIGSRLTGPTRARTDSTDPFYGEADWTWDYMDGYWTQSGSANPNLYSWMWKRAKGYMDVVAYAGVGGGRVVSHSLGVEPEMIWIKNRDFAEPWSVGHAGLNGGVNPWQYWIMLNDIDAQADNTATFNDTAPTDTQFTVGNDRRVDFSGLNYIAYLFATLDGISKVGSYSGTGTAQNIDCGFTSGARFILIKRSDSTGNWYFWDSVRGISAGNDPYLLLNSSAAEVTNTDYIDPLSSGFTVTSSAPSALNANGGSYIFYAIA